MFPVLCARRFLHLNIRRVLYIWMHQSSGFIICPATPTFPYVHVHVLHMHPYGSSCFTMFSKSPLACGGVSPGVQVFHTHWNLTHTHTGFFMQAHNGKSSTEGARRKPQPRLMTFWDCIELNCPFKRVTLLMRSSITTGGEEKTSSWKVDQTVVMEAP